MKNTNQEIKIAIKNNYLPLKKVDFLAPKSLENAATVVSNMNAYGFMPSMEIFEELTHMDLSTLTSWWSETEFALREFSGADKDINGSIVYKNFPEEVMNKSQAEYLIDQICIYFGVPYDLLRESEKPREQLREKTTYKVLQKAPENYLEQVSLSLIGKASRWTDLEMEEMKYLFLNNNPVLDIQSFAFKMNAVSLSRLAFENDKPIIVKNAMDVLRIALLWSDLLDTTPTKLIKFKNFTRKERRFLLGLLNSSETLQSDLSMKKAVWKKLFQRLNPSDYNFDKVIQAYDAIYNKKIKGGSSEFFSLMNLGNPKAMLVAEKKSSGFYLRNFHQLYAKFGQVALTNMIPLLKDLTINQLLKLEKYLLTENAKEVRIIAPKGNWNKSVLVKNNKQRFKQGETDQLLASISSELNTRLSVFYPEGVLLSKEVDSIKIPTNDMKIDFYGRGTSFDIPQNIKSVRLFSHWIVGSNENVWFDNGVTLFDENKAVNGFCDWATAYANDTGAVFSGDPLPSNDKQGKAAQGIDLNIDSLVASGHRYALWSILSYNDMPFNEACEVYADMQFCEEPQVGEIFEPKRSQMSFDIKCQNKSKYVAYVDLVERKVVFLDASMPAKIHGVKENEGWISERFSSIVEYVNSQPSVYDLFKHLKNREEYSENTLSESLLVDYSRPVIGFSDASLIFKDPEDVVLETIEKEDGTLEEKTEKRKVNAYLFKHTKESNAFDRIAVLDLLSK